MTTITDHVEVQAAHEFFEPTRLWSGSVHPALTEALADAPPVAPTGTSVFTSSANGLLTCILAEQQVSKAVQKQLDIQKQHLMDLTGVASAYVRKQADTQKNPDLVYDTDLWQNVYNHLPLMGPSEFTNETYNESLKGVEVATSFIEMLLGFAAGAGPALTAFSTFLQGLGDSIKAGVQTKDQAYHTASIGMVLETQVIGNETQVIPSLKAYFIDFTEAETNVYSNCASYESFDMSFNYRFCQSVFNSGALQNKAVSKQFNAFIHGTQIDDVKSAQNFFGGTFAPSSPPS
jgi:hypothetical protein